MVDKGLLKIADSSLKNLFLVPESSERNDLLHNLIIMLSNIFGDYETSDLLCDKMFKETSLPHSLFKDLLFQIADRSLLKTLARDISYFIHNLSETDEPWCLN